MGKTRGGLYGFLAIFLLFVFVLFAPNIAPAQVSAFGTVSLSDLDDANAEADFRFGTGLNFNTKVLGLKVVVQPAYVQKGADYQGTKFKLDYLEASILVRPGVPFVSSNIYLLAGGTVGYNIKAEVQEGNVSTDVSGLTDNFDYGLAAGVGYGFALLGQDLHADALYFHGMANIADGDLRNRDFRAMLAIEL